MFSKSGGTLKRTPGQMKIRHMHMVMDFKMRLKNPTDRDQMLIDIKCMMGASEKYNRWFDGIYRLYRSSDIPRYEKVIRRKWYYEKSKKKTDRFSA